MSAMEGDKRFRRLLMRCPCVNNQADVYCQCGNNLQTRVVFVPAVKVDERIQRQHVLPLCTAQLL